MSNFKPTKLTTLPKVAEVLTPDALYWKQNLGISSKVIKEYGPINSLDTHPLTYDILVTSSRLALYSFDSLEEKRTFKNNTPAAPFGGQFRRTDGKLFVSGAEDGVVYIHDLNESKPLRYFNDPKSKHVAAVRRCTFRGHTEVVSFSDDKCVKLWDIASTTLVSAFGEKQTTGSCETLAHSDYIRAGYCLCDEQTPLIVSGSYDHTVKVWDPRTTTDSPTHAFDIGHPVESVIAKGSLVVASGAKAIFVYDLVASKLIQKLSNVHSKTITSLASLDKFVLSASLDGQVRVYDNLFKPVMHLPLAASGASQILNLCVTNKCVISGNSDGSLSVRKFKSAEQEEQTIPLRFSDEPISKSDEISDLQAPPAKRARYFNIEVNKSQPPTGQDGRSEDTTDSDVQRIRHERASKGRQHIASYDAALKKFQHSRALDMVLKNEGRSRPEIVVSVMQELTRRSALRIALAGRSDKELTPLIDFIATHVRDPKYIRVLIDVASTLVDIYAPYINQRRHNAAPELFGRLASVVSEELLLMQQMKSLAGQLTMILNNC